MTFVSTSAKGAGGASVSVPATTLPGSPTNGQLAILTDSTTAPTWQWLLMFDTSISGTSKWRFVGGDPAVSIVNTDESTGSATYVDLATVGPSFTVPVAGTYQPTWSFETYNSTAGNPDMFAALKFGTAATSDNDASGPAAAAANHAVEGVRIYGPKAGTAADVWKLQYRTNTATAHFRFRALSVVPVLLG